MTLSTNMSNGMTGSGVHYSKYRSRPRARGMREKRSVAAAQRKLR